MSPAQIARLDMDIRSPESGPPDPRVEPLDCYALPGTDPARYRGLVVTGMVDQEFLLRHRDWIEAYLGGGGVLVFGGHLHRRWLPGASPFVPLEPAGLAAYRVTEIADHPLFAGRTPDELTFRRGVAGFFARGHHPPPPGAQVLVRLAGGQPCTYLDQVSTAGTILVQATSDPLGTLGDQLIEWILAQSGGRREPRQRRAGAGLAAVYGGSAWHHRVLTRPKYARHLTGGLVYLPELADTDLTGYAGLVVPERMHRGLLTRAAPRILELLDAGGTVAAFAGGEPIPEFLPGVRWQHRPTNFWWWLDSGAELGLCTPNPSHPLFTRLSLRDCTWHYHGVLEPPDGAEVLVTLPTGEVLLYLDRVSTPGTLVVSTLDPLSHHGGYFMPATERFLDGFLPWLASETAQSCRTESSHP
ncbi:MAG TPA: hypothetical protein VGM60_10300 [Pseudonocardia sp.]|jgi:hypothetical protein|uniref:hypothetical protein n=1 Tax=Pseudonocardia sp. TaxID=60912 RepID=UPI002F401130